MSDLFGEDAGLLRELALRSETLDLRFESFERHIDVRSRFHRVDRNSKHLGKGSGELFVPAGALFLEGFEFFDEKVEANDTQCVGIGGNDNVLAGKNRALGSMEKVGGTVEEDVVVLVLNILEFVEKMGVKRLLPWIGNLMFEIHQGET